jgi:hypothetical protein
MFEKQRHEIDELTRIKREEIAAAEAEEARLSATADDELGR